MSGIAGVLIAALVTPFIAVAGVAANSSITLFESLPSYLEVKPLQQKTELYATQGGQEVKFAEFYSQNRVEVPLDQVSPFVVDGAIATEDPRFYEHGGVDVIGATRALLSSVLGEDGGGASTITMQYVRNVRVQTAESILDPAARQEAYDQATEVTTARKLQEMRLAIGVEHQFTKEQILEGYLNIALFGGQVYGIESAAQYYFGVSAKDLTLPQAASLVATVQNPSAFRLDDPDNIEGNTERRDYVLRNMLSEKKITQDQYDEAVATPVEPNITPTQHGCMNASYNAQYFCDYVQKVILNAPQFGTTYEERLFNFQTKGYQIHTTLDLDLQQTAVDAINSRIPQAVDYMNLGTAGSVVQPGTGNILAMAQNKTFDETEAAAPDPTRTSVNFNTDYAYGGSSGFQIGSTYKMFTLANWLESGHSLYETVSGKTPQTFNQANFEDSCNPDGYGGSWTVNNDQNENFGAVNAVKAAQSSINTAFVNMGQKVDQCRTRDIAMGLGAHRADGQVNQSNPAAILGTNEVAPLSMATAIAALANNGTSCSPIAITSISLRDGTAVSPPASECKQVLDPKVAAATDFALNAVMTGGTGTGTSAGISVPLIGKTGTSDEAFDTWVVASSTKVGMALWIGNVEGKVSQYGKTVSGYALSQVRHPIANQIMKAATATYGGDAFPQPPSSSFTTKNVTVPNTAGMTVDAARSTLEAAGFTVAEGPAVDSPQAAGTVASTNPSAGTSVPQGSSVTISPSSGKQSGATPGAAVMPDLTGKSPADALSALSAAGFTNTGSNWVQAGGGGSNGKITRTDPAAGTATATDAKITIYVE